MNQDDIKAKVAFIVETDGLLSDYINSIVIKQIKSKMPDDAFKCLNTNHVHAALILKNIAPCPLKVFASTLRLSKSAASALVDRMVENGLVGRQVNEKNRREVLLFINPDFEKHVDHIKAELTKWFESLIDEMGRDTFENWHKVMVALNRIIKKEISAEHAGK